MSASSIVGGIPWLDVTCPEKDGEVLFVFRLRHIELGL